MKYEITYTDGLQGQATKTIECDHYIVTDNWINFQSESDDSLLRMRAECASQIEKVE